MDGSKIFGSMRYFILEKLAGLSDVVIESFFPSGRLGTEFMRSFLSHRWKKQLPSRPTFSATLSKLHREGLITNS